MNWKTTILSMCLIFSCAGSTTSSKNATQQEMVSEIQSTIAVPDGCVRASAQLDEMKQKYGESADYYYYKAYCYSDTNPDKACSHFGAFLKVAPTDIRAARAKTYISSHDPTTFASCTIPVPSVATNTPTSTPSPTSDKAAPEDSTPATAETAIAEIQALLADSDNCKEALTLLGDYRKIYGADGNYYYYRGYCYSDSNPDKACDSYVRFLSIAKADPKASKAKFYIASQDPTSYPNCVIP
jgi:tetratricopeptide (TPR) repeat protein